jgi:histone H3/H4
MSIRLITLEKRKNHKQHTMARIKAHAKRHEGKSLAHKSVKALKTSQKSKKTKPVEAAEPAKTAETEEQPKKDRKPHRFRPGTVALREIRRYQKSTDMLIPKAPFIRLVREVLTDVTGGRPMRITAACAEVLQLASESLITEVFDAAQTAAAANGRIQPTVVDWRLVMAMNPHWKEVMAKEQRNIASARAISRALRQEHAVREYVRVYSSVDKEKEALKKAQFEAERQKHIMARQLKKAESEAAIAAAAAAAAAPVYNDAEPADAPEASQPMEEEPAPATVEAVEPVASEPVEPAVAALKKKVKKAKTALNGKVNGVHHDVPVAAGAADGGFFSM